MGILTYFWEKSREKRRNICHPDKRTSGLSAEEHIEVNKGSKSKIVVAICG
jgi:hypothetical protein